MVMSTVSDSFSRLIPFSMKTLSRFVLKHFRYFFNINFFILYFYLKFFQYWWEFFDIKQISRKNIPTGIHQDQSILHFCGDVSHLLAVCIIRLYFDFSISFLIPCTATTTPRIKSNTANTSWSVFPMRQSPVQRQRIHRQSISKAALAAIRK